mgnify:CR=1 FL=1
MAFSPMFFRLGKGYTEVNPQGEITWCVYNVIGISYVLLGFWEPYSYGIFGMYKSDWINVGGFDVEKFSYEWGREDVDLADR